MKENKNFSGSSKPTKKKSDDESSENSEAELVTNKRKKINECEEEKKIDHVERNRKNDLNKLCNRKYKERIKNAEKDKINHTKELTKLRNRRYRERLKNAKKDEINKLSIERLKELSRIRSQRYRDKKREESINTSSNVTISEQSMMVDASYHPTPSLENDPLQITSHEFLKVEIKEEIVDEDCKEVTKRSHCNEEGVNKNDDESTIKVEKNVDVNHVYDGGNENELSTSYIKEEIIDEEIDLNEGSFSTVDMESVDKVGDMGSSCEKSTLYICGTCKKIFSQYKHLKRHEITHSGKKPHNCNYCEKSFSRIDHLKLHEIRHTGQRPFICDLCSKTFQRSDHLKKHKKMHAGIKPYNCQYCCKTFSQQSNLNKHLRTHTNLRPFECDMCEKTYKQSDSLHKHKRNQHKK